MNFDYNSYILKTRHFPFLIDSPKLFKIKININGKAQNTRFERLTSPPSSLGLYVVA